MTRVSVSLPIQPIVLLTRLPFFFLFPGRHSQSFGSEYGGGPGAEGKSFVLSIKGHNVLLFIWIGQKTHLSYYFETEHVDSTLINSSFRVCCLLLASEGTVAL